MMYWLQNFQNRCKWHACNSRIGRTATHGNFFLCICHLLSKNQVGIHGSSWRNGSSKTGNLILTKSRFQHAIDQVERYRKISGGMDYKVNSNSILMQKLHAA